MQPLLDPTILFFVLGVAAGLLKSNLEIPGPVARFLSLYLLMALGLKGGFALSKSGLTHAVAASLLCAVVLATTIPLAAYALLRKLVRPFDAAALAATYGSVSAVTFITAVQYLETRGTPAGGHMAAALALMESPAIVIGIVLVNVLRSRSAPRTAVGQGSGGTLALGGVGFPAGVSVPHVLRQSFTEGGQILLLGAMAVGLLSGAAGEVGMKPFSGDLFKGMLAFFLLDMGLLTAKHVASLSSISRWLLAYAVGAPVVHASLALLLAGVAGLSVPDATLLTVLAASASYIAVPAVLRHAVPEARPALYFGLSLGLTFPFNILVGIPLYTRVAQAWLG